MKTTSKIAWSLPMAAWRANAFASQQMQNGFLGVHLVRRSNAFIVCWRRKDQIR